MVRHLIVRWRVNAAVGRAEAAAAAALAEVGAAGAGTVPDRAGVAAQAVADAAAAYPDGYPTGPLAAERAIAAAAGKAAHEVDRTVGEHRVALEGRRAGLGPATDAVARDRGAADSEVRRASDERNSRRLMPGGTRGFGLPPWLLLGASLLPAVVDVYLIFPIFLEYAPVVDVVRSTHDTSQAWAGTIGWVLLQMVGAVIAGISLHVRGKVARSVSAVLLAGLLVAGTGATVVRARTFDALAAGANETFGQGVPAGVIVAPALAGADDGTGATAGWPTLVLFAGIQFALTGLAVAGGYLHAATTGHDGRDRALRKAERTRARCDEVSAQLRGALGRVDAALGELGQAGGARKEAIRAAGVEALELYRATIVRHTVDASAAQAIERLPAPDIDDYMPVESLPVLGGEGSIPASPDVPGSAVLHLGVP